MPGPRALPALRLADQLAVYLQALQWTAARQCLAEQLRVRPASRQQGVDCEAEPLSRGRPPWRP